MKESHKCCCVALVTVLIHLILLTYKQLDPPDSPSRLLSGDASDYDSHMKPRKTHVDLSSLSPLQTISFDGSKENAIFTSMLWNISNGDGSILNIPAYNATKRYKLLLDIGLETGSGLMCMLPEKLHANKVLVGVESHPLNFGLSSHNMLKGNPTMEDAKSRTKLLPFAMSDTDRYVKFNENFAPACGSILPSAKNAWWCALTSNVLYVPAISMDTLLRMVPSNYDFHYLKVDVEGAEELVLRGGMDFVPLFKMISLEINADPTKPNRVNEGNGKHIEALLKKHGFHYKKCGNIKSADCHFGKTELDVVEAARLHSLAIHPARRGERMSSKRCRELYKQYYVLFKGLK